MSEADVRTGAVGAPAVEVVADGTAIAREAIAASAPGGIDDGRVADQVDADQVDRDRVAGGEVPGAAGTTGEPEKRKRGRPRGVPARRTRTVELILTVTGTMDGDWQAELVHSGQRVLQGVPVPAAAVARAAKELHPDVSGAIDEVLESAREQHRAKVEQLQAELERAQRALADLT